jgi:hypothetical protein
MITGEKLLISDELSQARQQETQARQLADERAEQAQQQLAKTEALLSRYQEKFGELPE